MCCSEALRINSLGVAVACCCFWSMGRPCSVRKSVRGQGVEC